MTVKGDWGRVSDREPEQEGQECVRMVISEAVCKPAYAGQERSPYERVHGMGLSLEQGSQEEV